jgi:ribosomal protein L16 Arg81 hydroxylase
MTGRPIPPFSATASTAEDHFMDIAPPLQDTSDAARIAALVHPMPPEEFMARHWPGTFQLFTGPAGRLADLLDQPEFGSIDALVRCPLHGSIRADYTREKRDSEMAVTPERALALYRSACTIYMTRLASDAPRRWAQALDAAFGLLPGTAQVNAFASMPGPGLSWHWDPQELFIVQVRGRKLWHVAPNEYLDWPTASGQAGAERRPEIRFQLKDPARPVETPATWSSIEMVPGSVMFLPRGYWHTTENIDESLHLVLQVKVLSWRDVFAFLLESVPDLYGPEWRRPTLALRPERLMDAGLREFRERCAALSAFASPQGVQALSGLFSKVRTQAAPPPAARY